MKKKKQITLTIEEWKSILMWCETYYHEWMTEEGTPERREEEEEEKIFEDATINLRKKLYGI